MYIVQGMEAVRGRFQGRRGDAPAAAEQSAAGPSRLQSIKDQLGLQHGKMRLQRRSVRRLQAALRGMAARCTARQRFGESRLTPAAERPKPPRFIPQPFRRPSAMRARQRETYLVEKPAERPAERPATAATCRRGAR
eukprot:TRINITY_DN19310_c0_g1_i1.p1 TRINITY_DN19310_c0_g1~~TRINITY_DN19310_c0_g1_i1.p1  ORF type:complete len:137 (-),score=16.39 TRINITY_DN19310_c0_g1_i1:147-557(-)